MSFLEIIEQNKNNFIKFNDIKINRLQSLFPNNNIEKTINSIPFLLSVNHKNIPGYVEGNTISGIINYKPETSTIKYFKTRFHISELSVKNKRASIEMLALIGSVGTIAFTKNSDFDYWICIRKENFSSKEIELFAKKVEALQKWITKETKVEIHFFVNDIENIKKNIFAEDEDEAFGSTIGATLKDEFFRSSIIIEGKIPFWWMIPSPVTDKEYEKLFAKLSEEQKNNDFIDIGNLYYISKADFLGAALFQLIKSLGNPFKSILKIGVLEKYLSDKDRPAFLSNKLKSNILRDNLSIGVTDSYILMFEEVYSFYGKIIEDKTMLTVLQENLYLKIKPNLSRYAGIKAIKLPYKVKIMLNYIKKWKWDIKKIKFLDDFENWDYNQLILFGNKIKKFMLLSYQRIAAEAPNIDLSKKISDSDFKLLSRKIKTNFISGKDKIDNYITFKDTTYESIMYIKPIDQNFEKNQWKLLKRNTNIDDSFVSTDIKIEPDLVKLLSWTAINKLYNPNFSRIKFQSAYTHIDQKEINELLTKIFNQFTENKDKVKNSYFLTNSFQFTNLIILNFATKNNESIENFYHLYSTSWKESFLKKYDDENELANILISTIKNGVIQKKNFDSFCTFYSPDPFNKLYKHIEKTFSFTYNFLVKNKTKKALTIITILRKKYIAITNNRNKIYSIVENNLISILSKLSLQPQKDVIINFFGEDSELENLQKLYDIKSGNSITIFFEEKKNFIFIYTINERGNLFTNIIPLASKEIFLISLLEFCNQTINTINSQNYLPNINKNIRVHQLSQNRFGESETKDLTEYFTNLYLLKRGQLNGISIDFKTDRNSKKQYNVKFMGNETGELQITDLINSLEIQKYIKQTMLIHQIQFLDNNDKIKSLGSTIYFLEKAKTEYLFQKISSK